MSKKYEFLRTKVMVIVNRKLGFSKQAIRTTSSNHVQLLQALNDAIGEAIEKVLAKFGGSRYKENSDKKNKRNKR
jgi:hypothetical protein